MATNWVVGVVTIGVAILIYKIIKLINRPSLPLPPGPKPWPIVGNFPHVGAVPHHAFAAMCRKYGPLLYLRLGSLDVVVAGSAAVAEQFLKVHDAIFCDRPANAGTRIMNYDHQGFVFAPYGPRWRLSRKITTSHMLSGTALENFRHMREEEAARMMRNLANSGSKAVKLGTLLNDCTTNALGRVMLGIRVFNDAGGDCDPRAEDFRSMVMETMVLGGAFNIGDYVPALAWLDLQGLQAKMKQVHHSFDAFLTRIIDEHKTRKIENHNDLLSIFLSLREDPDEDNGGKLTDNQIKALLMNMFIAASDPVTSTIEWTLSELMKNPRVMTKVREELDRLVGQERLVSELDLPHLPYLEAVVKETFRLHPATPLSLPRASVEDCEIMGYHIPKGSTLLVNVWGIGRDPMEWVNPLEFRPERFLPGGEKAGVDVRGTDFELIPFGAGRRMCAGHNLGIRTVQLLTATLAHAFDWELENGLNPEKLNMDEVFGLTLQRAVPLYVHPRPRLPSHVYSSST